MSLQAGLLAPTESYPWVAADVDLALLLELSRRTCQPGNQYRLGGKAPRLSADSATIAGLRRDLNAAQAMVQKLQVDMADLRGDVRAMGRK